MKCKLNGVCKTIANYTESIRDLPLLLTRLVLAYGFWTSGMMKWNDINAIGDWFATMNYPLPHFNAYMAGVTEVMGAIMLLLGLGTRLISIPLMVIMIVAITTVHMGNGFNAGDNGIEIALYYFTMLFMLLVYGSGKFSVDTFVRKYFDKN